MISLILLAGGTGSRMGSPTPKQYLPLRHKPLALHSFHTLSQIPAITQIVIACDPAYQHIFAPHTLFAAPGPRRQDSVYSGLLKTTGDIILVHDAARPLLEARYIEPLLAAVRRTGAAALAAPVTSTIKQCTPDHIVQKTLDRTTLWEIQTPQAVRRSLLLQAFAHNRSDVTDELSLIEAIGHPAEIVPCTPRNLKVTTPFDLTLAEALCATN